MPTSRTALSLLATVSPLPTCPGPFSGPSSSTALSQSYKLICPPPFSFSVSNYPGAPGYISSVAYTTTPASLLPTATYIPALYVGPNLTYANGTRTDCSRYLDGTKYQQDLSNTTFASTCDLALSVFGIQFADLTLWNPSFAAQSLADARLLMG